MCFFEKNDILIWINLEGYEGRLMLRLQLDGKGNYNDYLTIERGVGGTKGTEVLFILAFKYIRDLYYMPSNSGGPYKICIDLPDGDPRLMNILVEKHCFNYFAFRKIMKTYQKNR